jgi:hypothetical protein
MAPCSDSEPLTLAAAVRSSPSMVAPTGGGAARLPPARAARRGAAAPCSAARAACAKSGQIELPEPEPEIFGYPKFRA